jgi:hypothetical protein
MIVSRSTETERPAFQHIDGLGLQHLRPPTKLQIDWVT